MAILSNKANLRLQNLSAKIAAAGFNVEDIIASDADDVVTKAVAELNKAAVEAAGRVALANLATELAIEVAADADPHQAIVSAIAASTTEAEAEQTKVVTALRTAGIQVNDDLANLDEALKAKVSTDAKAETDKQLPAATAKAVAAAGHEPLNLAQGADTDEGSMSAAELRKQYASIRDPKARGEFYAKHRDRMLS